MTTPSRGKVIGTRDGRAIWPNVAPVEGTGNPLLLTSDLAPPTVEVPETERAEKRALSSPGGFGTEEESVSCLPSFPSNSV